MEVGVEKVGVEKELDDQREGLDRSIDDDHDD